MTKPRLDVPQMQGRGAWLFLFFGLLIVAGILFLAFLSVAGETP